ncbi:hypothetical protein ACFWBG_34710 [Nocardia salmonicida]
MNITPDPDEIVQEEAEPYETRPVAVSVCGPTEVRELPASGYPGYKTDTATAAVAVRVLALEPRRQYATLIAQDQDVWISSTQAGAQSGAAGAMRIPAVLPYVVRHTHELWVCAVTGSTAVGVESVYWSQ